MFKFPLVPSVKSPWKPLAAQAVADLLVELPARWWLSGGAALDQWLGRPIRARSNTDVSVLLSDLPQLVASLPAGLDAWVLRDDDVLVPFAESPGDVEIQPVLVRDVDQNTWALKVNVEDGTAKGWVYKRDPRLQLPWERAVVDVGGIPTGAPELQLVWKALRPRPEDDLDKNTVLPKLSDEARAWYERCILTIHPHSSWSIQVRSPLAPAKASWNRRRS